MYVLLRLYWLDVDLVFALLSPIRRSCHQNAEGTRQKAELLMLDISKMGREALEEEQRNMTYNLAWC